MFANMIQLYDKINWNYKTETSDNYCLAMNDHECSVPRGKVMGGSSVLNYMIYTRGDRKDYDNWSRLGCKGWSYDEILPYFKKLENFSVPEYYDPKIHGKDGPVHIEISKHISDIGREILKVGNKYGLKDIDYGGHHQIGLSKIQLTTRNGIRCSSNRAYLHPIRDRKNLHVSKYSQVVKILIDSKKRAYGVEFIKDNIFRTAKASKEVILSAGAINSPKLLMLSGIGPKEHLKSLDIDIMQDLPVGKNLMDHVMIGGLTFSVRNKYKKIRTEDMLKSDNFYKFLHGTGPLITSGAELLSFHEIAHPTNVNGYPDIEFLFVNADLTSDIFLHMNFNLNETLYNRLFKNVTNLTSTFTVFVILQRPKSKGHVMLRDKTINSMPRIIPNYFAHKDDVNVMTRGAKLLLKFMRSPAMKSLNTTFYKLPIRACNNLLPNEDNYWECIMRHFSFTIYHQSGTCRMGPIDDHRSVVDPNLNVIGTNNLRVIDASIIPEIMTGHPNGPVFMIGEKGADLIKKHWSKRQQRRRRRQTKQ